MNKSIRSKVSLIILIYIILTAAFSVYIYRIEYKSKEEQLNNSLYAAAKSLDMIIGPDFFDQYNFNNRISAAEYEKITKVLNNFADSLGLEYVYAMVRQNSTIYFVVSNETEDDLIRGTPSLFYNPYPFPPKDLTDAFDAGKVTYRYYSAYRNIWNSYYSIFLPGISPEGNKYMLAADIKLQDQISILRSSIYKAVILICIFMIPLIPLTYILKKGADRRTADLEKLIYSDKLTHLPNRDGFIRDTAPVERKYMSVIMIDIDSFRDINNLFGGIVGDRVLLRIADIINEICTPHLKLYKFPVDEFIILAKDCGELDFIIQTAEKIINTISDESFVNIGQPLDLTVTAGIVYQETMHMELLSHANIAKNRAKYEKKGWILYDDSMKVETNYNNNFKTIGIIKEAIKADAVIPYYQPIKNNYTDEIEKYEALIRIRRENGEVLLPGDFLEVARKSKLYKELTLCMIRKSFRDFTGMGKTISLNFSARDIEDDSTVDFLVKCCRDYNMQHYVIIELLESESIIHYETIFRNIHRLKEEGIRIAIDDFGSGYSNFIYLSQFHANYIKIDGTLIKKLLTEKHSDAIITAISAFARDLDISLIAEFVSNEKEITRLKELNVEFSQGFYIGKPKPFEELNIKRSPRVKI